MAMKRNYPARYAKMGFLLATAVFTRPMNHSIYLPTFSRKGIAVYLG